MLPTEFRKVFPTAIYFPLQLFAAGSKTINCSSLARGPYAYLTIYEMPSSLEYILLLIAFYVVSLHYLLCRKDRLMSVCSACLTERSIKDLQSWDWPDRGSCGSDRKFTLVPTTIGAI